jgi:ABC-type multidrug transport system ATPase subunit
MAIEIAPFQLLSGKETLSFPSTSIVPPGIVQISSSDWRSSQAIAFSAFGFDDELVENLGYRISTDPQGQRIDDSLRRSYVSPTPNAEVSLFWDTVAEEISLGDLTSCGTQTFKTLSEVFGLASLLQRQPSQLSGGETAKIILAGHFLARPDIIIVDRILGEIDVQTRSSILNYVQKYSEKALLVAIDNLRLDHVTAYWNVEQNTVEIKDQLSELTDSFDSLFSFDRFTIDLYATQKATSREFLAINNLSLERNGKPLFQSISFNAYPGTLLWILGPNGSGKTSFLEVLLELIRPSAGTIYWVSEDTRMDIAGNVSYSPQEPESDVTELTLYQEIELAFKSSWKGKDDWTEWLLKLGLPSEVWHLPFTDDVSLKKLASVLAAICRNKKICLLDEPTLFLSGPQKSYVVKAIHRFLEQGGVVMCSTHDNKFFNALCKGMDRIARYT